MHPHHHPFYDSFWSPTAAQDPLPNFSYGLSVLHQKLQQSIEENTVIANYLRQRASVEKTYAQQLASLQAVPKPGKAFERDVGAGLKKCFEVVRAESIESVETHRRRGDNLVSTALDPLERFGTRYERIVTRTRKDMEQCIARFDQSGKELEQAKATYNAKCRALQLVDPEFVPPDQPTWLGPWTFTQRQVAHLLDTMEDGMNGQTILDRDFYKHRNQAVVFASMFNIFHIIQQVLLGNQMIMTTWNNDDPLNLHPIALAAFSGDGVVRTIIINSNVMSFISMAATLSNTIPLCAELYDRMMLYQETLKPDKDVEFIVEQYRTGRFCPKPILYNNFYYGSAMDQVFGVSLEEYSRMHKVVIPPLISKGLDAIEAGVCACVCEIERVIRLKHLLLTSNDNRLLQDIQRRYTSSKWKTICY
ncbi:hypothetical protein K492DRAFT_167013 [Lichtheimia hyalospora FSU 10163]|nr:hypothetical protein K492DRAFT_167013 [Lichtheimia hyalospora FSU 10163]